MALPYSAHHYIGEFSSDILADDYLLDAGLGTPVPGLMYFNTVDQSYRLRDSTAWVPLVRTDDIRLGIGERPTGPVLVSFSEANKTFKEVSSATYESIQQFPYPGIEVTGTIYRVTGLVHRVGGTAMDIRIIDITHAAVIAELIGITDIVPAIRELPIVTPPATGFAIWAVELRRVGGGSTARCSSVLLEF